MQNTYTAGVLGVLYEKSILSTTISLKSPFPVQKKVKKFSRLRRDHVLHVLHTPAGGGVGPFLKKNMQNMQNTYTVGVWGFLYKKSILSTTTSLKSPFPVQKMHFFAFGEKKRSKIFRAFGATMFCIPPRGG